MRASVLLWILLSISVVASAAEVPETAYTASLGVPPHLVDHEALLFAYPQLGQKMTSRAFVLGLSDEVWGGVYSNGSRSISLLAQDQEPLSPLLPSRRTLQLGLGSELGPVGLGLGLGAFRYSSETTQSDSYNGTSRYVRSKQDDDGWFIAIGAGLRGERWFVDAVATLDNQESDAESRSEFTYSTGDWITSNQSARKAFDDVWSGRIRAGFPLGAAEARITARWLDGTFDVEAMSEETMNDVGDSNRLVESYPRKILELGASVTGQLEPVGAIIGFASMTNDEYLASYSISASSGQVRLTSQENDTLVVGLGIDRAILSRFHLLAGLQTYWIHSKRTDSVWADGEAHYRTSKDDSNSDGFSWGLRYEHDTFIVTGSMGQTIDLDRPFVRLDLVFVF